MADIFVSYARGEKARVAPLVAALEAQGWSVWWDPAITPGQEFDPLIRREIEAAQAVIVVWTPLSVESRWVRGEAQLGAERGILVPVRFDKARLPIDALALHTTDLDDWKGDERSAPFQELLRALGAWLKPAPKPTPAAKPRIAILPFENLSPDPANAFFTDGLHEEILSTLANSAPGLEVISRTTMASYKGRPVTVAEVSEKLGCSHVLEGSVRREGDQVRLTLQLIDSKSDAHVWAQRYDRKLVSAMTLQAEVAGEVCTHLAVKLTGAAQRTAPPTTDPVAYDFYLKAKLARQVLAGPSSLEEWRDVERLLNQALQHDPNFARAYVMRFSVAYAVFMFGLDPGGAGFQRALADLDRARKLAPADPVVIGAEALLAIADHNLNRAFDTFARAESAGLTDPDLLQQKAFFLGAAGRMDESLREMERLAALDPGNDWTLNIWVLALVAAHRPEEAYRVAGLHPAARGYRAYIRFLEKGEIDEFVRAGTGPSADPSTARLFARPTIALFDGARMLRARPGSGIIYEGLRAVIDGVKERAVRGAGVSASATVGLGRTPIASPQGWDALLRDDASAAAKLGREISEFVQSAPQTKWNAWFIRMLGAEALLFSSDKRAAVETAREAAQLAPYAAEAYHWVTAQYHLAQILAWTDSTDEAAAVLEALSVSVPGLPPAVITLEPIFTVALADNARFQALKAKLEAQMAALKLD